MISSTQRRKALEGLFLGVAIGDALGLAREGMRRRSALRMWGRAPLRYRLLPGMGIGSDETQMAGMTGQAILRSYCKSDRFLKSLGWRFRWWLVALPIGIGLGTLFSCLRLWLGFGPEKSGGRSAGNGPAVRAIVIGACLSETDVEDRTPKWTQLSTEMTHRDPRAVAGALLLAKAARLSILTRRGLLDAPAALRELISQCDDLELRDLLERVLPWLEQGIGPSRVAKRLGWSRGISGYMPHTATMALYCWLRYPKDFRRAVESAVTLGGDSDSVAAITGGLAGLHCRSFNIPTEWIDGLREWPADVPWHERLSERLSQWPHGENDILHAHSESFFWPGQILRNLLMIPLVLLHVVLRFLRKLLPC